MPETIIVCLSLSVGCLCIINQAVCGHAVFLDQKEQTLSLSLVVQASQRRAGCCFWSSLALFRALQNDFIPIHISFTG